MSKIEWATDTWNPVTGCDKVSPGCDHCYAEGIANRFAGTPAFPNGFAVTLRPERLSAPLTWRKPRRVFVNSMSDLFHADVPDEYIAQVWAVMAMTPQHTYQVLTKRHGRMRSLLSSPAFVEMVDATSLRLTTYRWAARDYPKTRREEGATRWAAVGHPLPNVWLGVSVENQKLADLRIPALIDTPAAVRFLSMEPLLGPVDLSAWMCDCGSARDEGAAHDDCSACSCVRYVVDYSDPERYHTENIDREEVPGCLAHHPRLDWVIVGGESGHGARPMDPAWPRSIRDQCTAAGVPFFFKQWGGRTPKANGRELDGRTWDEYPTAAATEGDPDV